MVEQQTDRPNRAQRRHPDEPRLWSIDDLADYLGVPTSTIYQWRSRGQGPRGVRVGRYVRWRPEVVMAWLEEKADVPRPAA